MADGNVFGSWIGPVTKGVSFFCPGCNDEHVIQTEPPRWQWNGNKVKPTVNPSILVSYPAFPDASEELKHWRKKRICHSWIFDGKIRFEQDSTHELSGKTVELPPWPNSDPW